MSKKSTGLPNEVPKRQMLQMPRVEAKNKLQAQIIKGEQLLRSKINTIADLGSVQSEETQWSKYNVDLLRSIIETNDLCEGYYAQQEAYVPFLPVPLDQRIGDFRRDVRRNIAHLESALGRIELYPEPSSLFSQEARQKTGAKALGSRVFVVHGHDMGAKESVARFIEKLGLQAIILHEQPNQGRTIIEKFEDYADVGFAVVLLTPDDAGWAKAHTSNARDRARQNVILELGFFIGRLGRDKVCALVKGEIELPSDISGVVYTPMDANEVWRLELAKEMKAANLNVDLNKLP